MVVGSGGREYAIGRALHKDAAVEKIYFAPGNGATPQLGENVDISDYEELADYVEKEGIDLTVVGPEAPLVGGIVDIFKSRGLKIFGPSREAAQLEGSKIFMKNFLSRHNIPTARYIETESVEEAFRFIESLTPPIVVKADGLCAGKGVIIAQTYDDAKKAASQMLSGKSFGEAGTKIVVEVSRRLRALPLCDLRRQRLCDSARGAGSQATPRQRRRAQYGRDGSIRTHPADRRRALQKDRR